MKLDPIALSIPLFFGLLAFEVRAARRRGLRAYRFPDTLTNLGIGMSSEVVRVVLGALSIAIYELVYRRFHVLELSPLLCGVAAFFGVDFFYYWFHRFCHRINFMWAMHVVHHQSQDYNLGVALRQSWFQGFAATALYLPLAVLGVPTAVWVLTVAISLLYQFWIHTELIGTLGVFERWFNTPSHHRVHHGINPEYIDRNHGGTLIVWDRLFGTFELERAPVVFGTVKPFTSWNGVWANFDYWAELGRRSRRTRRFADKLRIWFADPSWLPDDLGGPSPAPTVDARTFVKWDTPTTRALRGYVNAHFALVAAALGGTLVLQHALPLPFVLGVGAWVIVTTIVWGGLLEDKPWARPLEWARHGLLLGLFAWAFGELVPSWVGLAAGGVTVLVSALAFRRLPAGEGPQNRAP